MILNCDIDRWAGYLAQNWLCRHRLRRTWCTACRGWCQCRRRQGIRACRSWTESPKIVPDFRSGSRRLGVRRPRPFQTFCRCTETKFRNIWSQPVWKLRFFQVLCNNWLTKVAQIFRWLFGPFDLFLIMSLLCECVWLLFWEIKQLFIPPSGHPHRNQNKTLN